MKKLLSLILAFCILVSCVPAVSAEEAETPSSGYLSENLKYTLEDGVLTIGLIENPIEGVSCNVPALRDCGIDRDSITTVIVEDGVAGLERGAFSSCTNLTSVTLPERMEGSPVWWDVFYGCRSLPEITVPEGVTELECTFYGCHSLRAIHLSSTVQAIDMDALRTGETTSVSGSSSLSTITVAEGSPYYMVDKNSVLYQKDAGGNPVALVKCPTALRLAKYTVPSTVASIEPRAFEKCANISEMVIEDSETPLSIGTCAFLNSGIYTYHLPGRLKVLGSSAFKNHVDYDFPKYTQLKVYYSGTSEDWTGMAMPNYLYDGDALFPRTTFYHVDHTGDSASTAQPMAMITYAPGEGDYTHYGKQPPYPTPVQVGADLVVPGLLCHGTDKRSNYNHSFKAPAGGHFIGYEIEGTLYYPGDRYTVTGDTTLTAIWFDTTQATITLNAVGGTVPAGSVTVTKGEAFGSLPTPTRTGYSFTGWFTAVEGGTPVTAESIYNDGDPQVLYAHWEALPAFTATFDANGGTVNPLSKTIYSGENYGALPVPVWAGHDFDGWFTAPENGTVVTNATPFHGTANITLYAHWTEKKVVYNLTYDANGGTVRTGSGDINSFIHSFSPGDTYQTPAYTPTRFGYIFTGWYTERDGGTRVHPGNDITTEGNFTVYAHWEKDTTREVFEKLHYGFINSPTDFGYPSDYQIPYVRYKTIFGDNAQARRLYLGQGTWGGNCYGVATSAALLYVENNGINSTDFKSLNGAFSADNKGMGINWRRDLGDSFLTVRGFIECMQISAIDACVWDFETVRTQADYQQLVTAVKAVKNGGPPVNINTYSTSVGHALVGYDFLEIDESEDRIYVYDGNNKASPGYIALKKDSTGKYTGWSYGKYNKRLEVNYYNNFYRAASFLTGSQAAPLADKSGYLLLQTNTRNAKLYDANGKLAGELQNGILVENAATNIKQMLPLTAENAPVSDLVTLWVPEGLYTLANEDSSMQTLRATMADVEQSATVSTQSNLITFQVNDAAGSGGVNYVRLPEGGNYEIILGSSAAQSDYEERKLTGNTSGPMAFAQIGGKVALQGVDLSSVTLQKCVNPVYADFVEPETEGGECARPATGSGAPTGSDWKPNEETPQEMPSQISGIEKVAVTIPSGNSGTEEAILPKGTAYILPDCKLTPPAGKVFDGWSAGSQTAKPGEYIILTGPIEIAPIWKEKTTGNPGNPTPPSSGSTPGEGTKPEEKPNEKPLPFTDLKEDAWYRQAVEYVYSHGLMTGTGEHSFSPQQPVTRAMFLTILYRLEGAPATKSAAFSDVPAGKWYSDAVAWAKASGLAQGYDGNRFGPHDILTREQMATLLYRYAVYKGNSCVERGQLQHYRDAELISSWAREAMEWAQGVGLITGRGENLAPKISASRAEAAEIVMRACEKMQGN